MKCEISLRLDSVKSAGVINLSQSRGEHREERKEFVSLSYGEGIHYDRLARGSRGKTLRFLGVNYK